MPPTRNGTFDACPSAFWSAACTGDTVGMTTLEISGLALTSPMRAAAAIVLWLTGPVITGCGSTTSPGDWQAIPPTPPSQFILTTELEILPHPDPDSSALIFRATVGDSLPHIEWLPSALFVETDRGQELEVVLKPFACLLHEHPELQFPFTVEWFTCDVISLTTVAPLSPAEIAEIEKATSGDSLLGVQFQEQPGAQYWFTVPFGKEASAEAIRRADTFSFVERAFRSTNPPSCVLSDQVPPPDCPSWHLVASVRFSFVSAAPDTLFVSQGGWARARYLQSDGTFRTAIFNFPQVP